MPYTPMNQRKNYDAFGRIGLDDPVPDDEIRNFRNPTQLSDAVGATGRNKRRDVAKVEKMLSDAGTLDLKQTDGPTGYWGMRTADATRRFQEKEGLKVDGEIKPDGPTLRKLADKRDAATRRKERRETAPHLRKHFEEREAKNTPLPNSVRRAEKSGFLRYPDWQNSAHQNEKGAREVKYGHPDGREVVFDGDTGKVEDAPDIRGTYNYAVAPPFDPETATLEDWVRFLPPAADHFAKDIWPYWLHGAMRRRK